MTFSGKNGAARRKRPSWVTAFYVAGVLFALAFALLHLAGQSPHRHATHSPAATGDASP